MIAVGSPLLGVLNPLLVTLLFAFRYFGRSVKCYKAWNYWLFILLDNCIVAIPLVLLYYPPFGVFNQKIKQP